MFCARVQPVKSKFWFTYSLLFFISREYASANTQSRSDNVNQTLLEYEPILIKVRPEKENGERIKIRVFRIHPSILITEENTLSQKSNAETKYNQYFKSKDEIYGRSRKEEKIDVHYFKSWQEIYGQPMRKQNHTVPYFKSWNEIYGLSMNQQESSKQNAVDTWKSNYTTKYDSLGEEQRPRHLKIKRKVHNRDGRVFSRSFSFPFGEEEIGDSSGTENGRFTIPTQQFPTSPLVQYLDTRNGTRVTIVDTLDFTSEMFDSPSEEAKAIHLIEEEVTKCINNPENYPFLRELTMDEVDSFRKVYLNFYGILH